jgi:hypothetical protein
MQLENRGTVVGARTSGRVMEAIHYIEKQGVDTVILYGFSITDADLIMKDGESLEHAGVVPDEIVLPITADLAEGKDPVVARAAAIAGLNLDPDEAGKLFAYRGCHSNVAVEHIRRGPQSVHSHAVKTPVQSTSRELTIDSRRIGLTAVLHAAVKSIGSSFVMTSVCS